MTKIHETEQSTEESEESNTTYAPPAPLLMCSHINTGFRRNVQVPLPSLSLFGGSSDGATTSSDRTAAA